MESCCGRERLTKSLCSLPQGTTAPPWEQPPSEQHKAAASVTFAFPCRFTDRPTPFRKSKKPLKSFTIALRSDLFKICWRRALDRKSTRLNSSHGYISYAVFCLKKKKSQHLTASGLRSTFQ